MLSKKKYKQSEVQKLLNDCAEEYQIKIGEQKQINAQLNEENKLLFAQLEAYRSKDEIISSALKKSQEVALETEKKSLLQYSLTVERLRAFSYRWAKYFGELKEKYPLYPTVMEAVELNEKLSKILKGENVQEVFESTENLLQGDVSFGDTGEFDPKKKIYEYIAATSDNGFNLDEVLNPGRLELEDLCKELGTMEEDD